MDFIFGLPRSSEVYDSIWVIVDPMTKSAHFLPIKTTDPVRKLAKLYLKEIERLHGVPVLIMSDQDAKFTLVFWRIVQAGFDMRLEINTTSQPQTDG